MEKIPNIHQQSLFGQDVTDFVSALNQIVLYFLAILYSVTWGICAFKVIPYLLKPKLSKKSEGSSAHTDVLKKIDNDLSN